MFLKETLQKCLNFVTSDLMKVSLMPTVKCHQKRIICQTHSQVNQKDPSCYEVTCRSVKSNTHTHKKDQTNKREGEKEGCRRRLYDTLI